MALRVNDFLTGLFRGVGITLVDFKIEFGRVWEGDVMRIILADEISPDTCRLWDSRPTRSWTRTASAATWAMSSESYTEVARRLGILPEGGNLGPQRSQDDAVTSPEAIAMKARIHVTLKSGVLDPQGTAIGHALHNLGFSGVRDIRQGKVIELDLEESDPNKARATVEFYV